MYIPLEDLQSKHFAEWRDRRLQEVAPGTVLREWTVLSAVCSQCAKEWGWLHENPMSRVKRPTEPDSRTRRLQEGEFDQLMIATPYDLINPPESKRERIGAAIVFAIETAMRAGEICNMTWEDINLELRTVHLPKTKNGNPRTVPLSTTAVTVLKGLQGLDDCKRKAFGLKSDSLDVNFRKIRSKCLIDDLHFHDLRREALTRLAKKVDVLNLAKISGHTDLRILQKVYYAPDMAAKRGETRGACKLCLEDKELVDSHIYPKFMWKSFNKYSVPYEFSTKSEYRKKRRDGIHKYLLCYDCEGVIGRYEAYASDFLRNRVKKKEFKSGYKHVVNVSDEVKGKNNKYDYTRLKLFFLSLLWRSSVSSSMQYNRCALNEYYNEILRKALLDSTVLDVDDFPIILRCYNTLDSNSEDVSILPHEYEIDNFKQTAYFFITFGLGVFIGIGSYADYPGKLQMLKGSDFTESELGVYFISIKQDSAAMEIFANFKEAGGFSSIMS